MNNDKLPKITVLMSVYNGARYLRQSIDSILNQTFSDFEFIIVNDASIDDTTKILSLYGDPRIRVINNTQNIGLTKSLNKGLKGARGEYIARMDADDISLPERLRVQKEFLENHPEVVCVGGSANVIGEADNIIGDKKAITDPEILRFHMIMKNQISHPSAMYRKSVVLEIGGYDENFKYAQDFELWSRLILKCHVLANIEMPVIRYRYYGSSITQGEKTRDGAYTLALKVMRRNFSHYTTLTEEEFAALTNSLHRQKVGGFKHVLAARRLWFRLQDEYFKKESVSPKSIKLISRFIKKEARNAFRWYLKNYFSI